jgi:hypothetical protein
MELVGLDVTNKVSVTERIRGELQGPRDNPAAAFWDAVLDANDWFIDSGEYYFWDVLAALVVVDRERLLPRRADGARRQLPRDRYALVADLGSQHARHHRGRPRARHFAADGRCAVCA